jgi:hypothetical protein
MPTKLIDQVWRFHVQNIIYFIFSERFFYCPNKTLFFSKMKLFVKIFNIFTNNIISVKATKVVQDMFVWIQFNSKTDFILFYWIEFPRTKIAQNSITPTAPHHRTEYYKTTLMQLMFIKGFPMVPKVHSFPYKSQWWKKQQTYIYIYIYMGFFRIYRMVVSSQF